MDQMNMKLAVRCRRSNSMMVCSLLLVLLMLVKYSEGQGMGQVGETVTCISQLAPCLNYLNRTDDPPSSCCNPLKSVIKTNPECLCNMISTTSATLQQAAGINTSDAQQLPARCGLRVDPISCLLANSPDNSDDSSAAISSIRFPPLLLLTASFIALHAQGRIT